MARILIAYMPVLHEGYLQLIRRTAPDRIYIIGPELLEDVPDELDYVRRKDSIRAISAENMAWMLQGMPDSADYVVAVATRASVQSLSATDRVVMPDEDVSRYIAGRFLKSPVAFESVFLRWDRMAIEKQESAPDVASMTVSRNELDRAFMSSALRTAEVSGDWWRQIGALLRKDDEIVCAFCNTHRPHPHSPYAFGDPRSILKRGVGIECSTAEHGEAAVIAEAAKLGIATAGADLFVTAFPCPPCAYLIAHAGIKRLYFASGYSVLHGAEVLKAKGVELIFVEMETPRGL